MKAENYCSGRGCMVTQDCAKHIDKLSEVLKKIDGKELSGKVFKIEEFFKFGKECKEFKEVIK